VDDCPSVTVHPRDENPGVVPATGAVTAIVAGLLMKAARSHRDAGTTFPDPHSVELSRVRALAVDRSDGEDWRTG
jgi:hypothetical protein